MHAASMALAFASTGVSVAGEHVLDFGCAAGPVLRFLRKHDDGGAWWGCDIDPIAIEWCRMNFPPDVRFFTNTTAPHLPLRDASFGVVYACSVFTHIEHGADSWLLELARVMRPRGILFASIHDEAFIHNTIAHAPDWAFSRRLVDEQETFNDPQWRKIVLGAGHAPNVFYRREYFLRMTQGAFEYVSALPRGYGDQTVLVLRRRP